MTKEHLGDVTPASAPVPGPGLLRQISLVLLLAVGLSLLSPLLGGPMPPASAVLGVLGLRLALQLWEFWQGSRRAGRRPQMLPLLMSAVLLGLLVWQMASAAPPLPMGAK